MYFVLLFYMHHHLVFFLLSFFIFFDNFIRTLFRLCSVTFCFIWDMSASIPVVAGRGLAL